MVSKNKYFPIVSTWVASGRGVFISSFGPIIHEINTLEDVNEIEPLLRKLDISVVYLDAYRDGVFVPSYKLLHMRDLFTKLDYETRGGITLGTYDPNFFEESVGSHGFGNGFVCWTSQITREGFKFLAAEVARIFDFVLYDDCLFSLCFCDRCLRRFNESYGYNLTRSELNWILDRANFIPKEVSSLLRDWTQFQTNLYREVAAEYIVKPSREVNPNVKLVVKVPQWNEYFPLVGYNIEMLKEVFDEVWVGTEIREDLQSVGYFAYANAEFVRKCCEYDSIGTWFDTYRGYSPNWDPVMSPETYLEQARMSTLAKAKEFMLFSLGDLRHYTRKNLVDAFSNELPKYREVASIIKDKEPYGIRYLKSSYSTTSAWRELGRNWTFSYDPEGDLYLNAVLGSLGIPLLTTTNYNELNAEDVVLITAHEIINLAESKWDLIQFVQNGGVAILTSEALTAILSGYMGDKGYELIGISRLGSKRGRFIDDITKLFIKAKAELITCDIPITAGPILDLESDYIPIVTTPSEGFEIPIIYHRNYGLGRIVFLPITFPVKQFRSGYPNKIKNILREYLGQYVGIYVSSDRDSLCLFFYQPDIIAVINLDPDPAHTNIFLTHKAFSQYRKATDLIEEKEVSLISKGESFVIPTDIGGRSWVVLQLE